MIRQQSSDIHRIADICHIDSLESQIRAASDPDACHLISDYIRSANSLCFGAGLSFQLEMQYRVYSVLMETICDSLLPKHWRECCLDNLFNPLLALQRLASSDSEIKRVNGLNAEAAMLSQYFLSS